MSGDYSRFTFKPRKRFSGVLMQQGRVQLDADWNEEIEILKRRWEIQATDTFGHAAVPKKTTPNAFKITRDSGTGNITDVGVGRMYVEGLLAERFQGDPYLFSNLPFHPDPYELPDGTPAVVYLDVWEREVTYIEDADLLEPALGGPDTATRTQVAWVIQVMRYQPAVCGLDFSKIYPPSNGRLSSKAIAPPASSDPCVLPPSGGFRGLENRLYRVEIHDHGTLGTATFKWSRENASIVSRVTKFDGPKITVTRIGRDKVLRFQPGDWVEVTDDEREIKKLPGLMAKVDLPDEASSTLTLDRDLSAHFDASKPERHTRVRRWDQRKNPDGSPLTDGLLKTDPTKPWIELEEGARIRLTQDTSINWVFLTGDYWVFAARAVDGSVEELNEAPPRGIHHHYAQLAAWDGSTLHDCRRLWPDGCCCCTVEVGDGINSYGDFNTIAEAYAAAREEVPDDWVPIRICLLPGVHRPQDTLIVDRSWVTISGCGRASQVVAPRGKTIFELQGESTNVENVFMTSEYDGLARPPLLLLSYSYASQIEGNIFVSAEGPLLECRHASRARILRNSFRGNQAIQGNGWDLVVAWNEFSAYGGDEMRDGALIDLWPGCFKSFILENQLEAGPEHGIGISPSDRVPGYILYDIVIAGNDIRWMQGSGIATLRFLDSPPAPTPGVSGDPGGPALGTTPVYVYGLRIENNTISECVLSGWKRDDGAPQGGIVLGGIEHLEIADNQIESNGAYGSVSPVAGIYLGTVRGLIVRDNVVTNNGQQVIGAVVGANEGGIVARALSEPQEYGPSQPFTNTRIINYPPIPQPRPDGWPSAMVHGNLVVAPRGRALVLFGLGPMKVTDNRLIARELYPHEDRELIGLVGAVFIGAYAEFKFENYTHAYWSYLILMGDVSFSDNEVTLDVALAGTTTTLKGKVVQIVTGQDLAFHDNVVRLGQGIRNLKSNTQLEGSSVRVQGNGIFEEPIDGNYTSLDVPSSYVSIVTDNHVTHCISALNQRPLHVLEHNVTQLCGDGTFVVHEIPATTMLANRAMYEQMALSARVEASALRAALSSQKAAPERRQTPRPLDWEAKAGAVEAFADRLELNLRMSDRAKEIQPNDWSVLGRVLDEEGKPVAGAKLEISEGGKKLSSIPADDKGEFFAHYSGERFKDLFARSPQLTLTIKSADGKVIQTLDRPLVPKGDQLESLELRVGKPAAPTAAKQAEPATAAAPAAAPEEPPTKTPKPAGPKKTTKPKKPRPRHGKPSE
ncbi:MAG TPA: DUF6519 domain-containing protein [Thermoanaerobaculia bacterium]|nr:DUF6519 domain-containing protein [Thermoanaerobaculia bacterium]